MNHIILYGLPKYNFALKYVHNVLNLRNPLLNNKHTQGENSDWWDLGFCLGERWDLGFLLDTFVIKKKEGKFYFKVIKLFGFKYLPQILIYYCGGYSMFLQILCYSSLLLPWARAARKVCLWRGSVEREGR